MNRATRKHLAFIIAVLFFGGLISYVGSQINIVAGVISFVGVFAVVWELFYGPEVTWDHLDD